MSPFEQQNWLQAAAALQQRGAAYVIVTLVNIKGSAPRESGTKMLVTEDTIFDTVGGGSLEFIAIDRARALLKEGKDQHHMEDVALGAKLGQCCGGHVSMLFECFAQSAVHIAIFGAGHVGRALVPILGQLPLRVRWIDNREKEFPDQIPLNTQRIVAEHPVEEVLNLPVGSCVVVMTHEHPLDFAIVEAALKRGDCSYVGVIGSQTKAGRFKLGLAGNGLPPEAIEKLHCPIGSPTVPGKHPAEVAVSIAADLIACYHAAMQPTDTEVVADKVTTTAQEVLP